MKIKKEIVHFLHIGKTGGSIIRDAVEKHITTKNYKIKIHGHKFHLNDIPKGEKVVFFLREPISRFVSGFYSRQRRGKPLYNVPWKPGEEKAFKRFRTANELAMALSSKDNETKKAATNAMKNIIHVRNSFWDWFDNKKYFLSRTKDILFVGTQENLDKDFIKLKNILGLPPRLKLSKNKIKMHKNPADIDKRLSSIAKHNLKTWYKKDYDLIDLCKKKV